MIFVKYQTIDKQEVFDQQMFQLVIPTTEHYSKYKNSAVSEK